MGRRTGKYSVGRTFSAAMRGEVLRRKRVDEDGTSRVACAGSAGVRRKLKKKTELVHLHFFVPVVEQKDL